MSISSPGYFDRKPSTNVRPGLAHLQGDPSSPQTPQRSNYSAVSSPSASYRAEEEPLIFEFGARHFAAGYAGESYPRCTLGFGPEESRRLGDHRKWLPEYIDRSRKKRRVDTWGNNHELWRMDVRDLDMGLMEDKIERAVREAYGKYLLLDYKSTKKLVLVVPSVMPHQLLNRVLSALFQNSPSPPVITLLPPPALTTVAAGCRSSLVVDIGWRETVITAVYEHREIQESRTIRAMRLLTLEMARLMEVRDQLAGKTQSRPKDQTDGVKVNVDLEQAEEVTTRFAWCKSRKDVQDERTTTEDPLVQIPSPSSPRQCLELPFSALAEPVHGCLLASDRARELDDDEQPLHLLIYKSLLNLPPDARAVCMSHIVFTGGGSNIPGLKSRLLEEVGAILEDRGWDKAFGRAADDRRKRLKEMIGLRRAEKATPNNVENANGSHDSRTETLVAPSVPPHLEPRLLDSVEQELQQRYPEDFKTAVSGVVRGVETLGAWAGASLLTTLKIKSIVEIDKETFALHGLAGARKDAAEVSVAPQKGYGPTVSKAGDRAGWTLGAWA